MDRSRLVGSLGVPLSLLFISVLPLSILLCIATRGEPAAYIPGTVSATGGRAILLVFLPGIEDLLPLRKAMSGRLGEGGSQAPGSAEVTGVKIPGESILALRAFHYTYLSSVGSHARFEHSAEVSLAFHNSPNRSAGA